MPPRKSNTSATDEGAPDGISIEDLGLPRTMVQRLAKGVLPPNTSIQKDAVLAIQKSATVFINFLAHHANENTLRSGKKTIQVQDVMNALHEIEFENFGPRLEEEHQKFAAIQNDKRNSYRRKVKEDKLAAAARFAEEHTTGIPPASSPGEASFHTANGSVEGVASPVTKRDADLPPAAKKARRSDGAEHGQESDAEMDEDDGDQGEEEEDVEEDEEEEEEEGDEEDGADQLVEDPLELKDDGGDSSGEESD